jgi:V/A-type H+-transporting ATPase subunit E
MSAENIIQRILSDGESEANAIIANAEKTAAAMLAEVSSRAETRRKETETEVGKRVESIFEKRAADARLESAKILLAEKRKVLDRVYQLALQRLVALEKEDCLKLFASLLQSYAEEGDEIFLAENFRYEKELALLPIVQEKKLKIARERISLDGGMRLIGKVSDKELSFGAILATDRENYQAALAAELFK